MLPIADGSDFGGSLRNPANFCNIVGFRTSPGRVPVWPAAIGSSPWSVQGPMARTVQDVALMLSAIAGPDARSPISVSEPGSVFNVPLDRDFGGVRIAWSRDLGGLPVQPQVTSVIESQRKAFESLGCVIEDADPDLTGAHEVLQTLRAWGFASTRGDLLRNHRDKLKDTVIWNIEAGMNLTGIEIGQAEVKKTEIYHRMRQFMETYEFLILPVNQVLPFPVEQRYITGINGVKMETYIDWMKTCYLITVTGHPAISVPCGFSPEGLPVGVQIVGRYRDEPGVLQLAHAFEQATGFGKQVPAVALS
jgi:amidase